MALSKRAVRVAVVGMGNIGSTHARCYKADERAELVAVCDILPDRAKKAEETFGVPSFLSVKEMLSADLGIQAASVCSAGEENGGDHYVPTMSLLDAGIAVLGEKPISNRIHEAKEMVALARERQVCYGVNLNHRFTPAAKRAREWVTEGRLGNLNLCNMRMWINNPNETSPHFHMRALHPHSIDVMRYFCGDVERVQAFYKKGTGRQTWSNVQANLLFRSGVLGHLTGSYDAGGSFGLERCEVVGSEGRFVIDDACEHLTYFPRRSIATEQYDYLGGMQGFRETFASRIGAWLAQLQVGTASNKIDGSGAEALAAQLVIEACIRSFEHGEIVEVERVPE
jgi:myo-inositol 2-dehydrogenase / D-chiro-inositol 1-dehydrogenase